MKLTHPSANFLRFLGFPDWMIERMEDIEFTNEGNLKYKMRCKLNTKGWKLIMGHLEDEEK